MSVGLLSEPWFVLNSNMLLHYDGVMISRPVYLYNLGYFFMPKFSAIFFLERNIKIKINQEKKHEPITNISRYILRFICFLVWNMPSSGFLWCKCKSCDLLLPQLFFLLSFL